MTEALEDAIKFFNMRRYEIALQKFDNIDGRVLGEEEKADIAYYTGLCYTKLEKYEDALLLLEQVVTEKTLEKRIPQCRLTLAYIYAITKRAKMAEFELKQLVDAGQDNAQVYGMLAFAVLQQGDDKKAVEFYEKALAMDATNVNIINGLGFILVDKGIDVARGLALCKKAVEQKPQSAAYLDSLGWAYFKSGNTNEARICLRRALEVAPRHKEITSHMKIVLGET
jgi:Tfp pilus assembly protein PilF